MKNFKTLFISFVCIFIVTYLLPQEVNAATLWKKSHSDQSMAYSYPGYGWGSVYYSVGQMEEWEYRYQQSNSNRRQVNLSYSTYCPYTCELRFANKYYNSSNGSYITSMSMYSFENGVYWSLIQDSSKTNVNKRSPNDITSSINSNLNLKTVMQLYVYNDGSWAYVNSKDHWGYIR
jgi:hypothetical protein